MTAHYLQPMQDVIYPVQAFPGYDELKWSLKITKDPYLENNAFRSPQGYFYLHQFMFAGLQNEFAGYMGLQTVMGGTLDKKCAIFTIWRANNVYPGTTKYGTPVTGKNPSGTGEGDFCQALIPYPWVQGMTYNMSVKFTSSTLLTATVNNDIVGMITIDNPATTGKFHSYTISATERYWPGKNLVTGDVWVDTDCRDIAKSTCQWTNLKGVKKNKTSNFVSMDTRNPGFTICPPDCACNTIKISGGFEQQTNC